MAIESVGARSGRQRGGSAAGPLVLGPNDSLKGTLKTENSVTVQGSVEGEIVASGDVVVEQGGSVDAGITGRNVDIRGQVNGRVNSSERLSLGGSGTLEGDASAARLVVEDGATLNGSITMTSGRAARSESTPISEFGDEHAGGETEVNGELVHAGGQEG